MLEQKVAQFFQKLPIKSPNIWATFERKFTTKSFQKSPNLATLIAAYYSGNRMYIHMYYLYINTWRMNLHIHKEVQCYAHMCISMYAVMYLFIRIYIAIHDVLYLYVLMYTYIVYQCIPEYVFWPCQKFSASSWTS